MPSCFLTNNPHDHLKIAHKLYKASLTHLGHSFVHNPIKQAQERPLKNNIPLSPPTPTWELKKLYCRKQVKPLVFPSWGKCPIILFICNPFVLLSFCVLLLLHTPISMVVYKSPLDFCCSYSHMDTVHIVPSVVAV